MAYSKHTWQDGELITKELMNNLETGLETAANAVDDKLAKPSSNGTNEQILATDGSGGTKWVDKPAGAKGEKGDKGDPGQQLEHINNATGQSDAHTVLNNLLAGLIAKGYMKGA